MESRFLDYLVNACGAELVRGEPETLVSGLTTDSRRVASGNLFVAIAGDRYDGHQFLAEAANRGAAAVLVARGRPLPGALPCAVAQVADTRVALGKLAARYRRDYEVMTVAVGGSNGKTTTKELLASVLRERWRTHASEASFNNDIGVPLSLLQLDRSHQTAVLEVGTNHPGELAPLVRIIAPSVGVITSLGREHLEYFGSLEGVVQEEGWLAELTPADGLLVVHGDSVGMDAICRRTKARVISVGWSETNLWRVESAQVEESGVKFCARVDGPRARFSGDYCVNLVGRHQATNALLAAAVGAELGLEPEDIRRGLSRCRPARRRMQVSRSGGVCVVDDAYNANPDSMRAALEALRELPCRGRRIAVLGDMAELGGIAEAAHREVGRYAAETGVDRLLVVGNMAHWVEEGARGAGLKEVERVDDSSAAIGVVRALVAEGDVVLVKASRAARLEEVSEALISPQTIVTAN